MKSKRGRKIGGTKVAYTGTRGLEVLKLLLFHGFKRMCDIVTLSHMSRTLRAYALKNVYFTVTTQTFIKEKGVTPLVICCATNLPTVSLSSVQKSILIFTTRFSSPVRVNALAIVNYSAYSNLQCHLLLTYDAELRNKEFYQLFSNPPSHIAPHMTFVYTNEHKTHVKEIGLYVTLLKK